jgi:maltose-binding protein MalE
MKKMILGTALALGLTMTSCLGPNNAFNNLTHWNKKVTDSKWGNEAIFLGLNIVFVYPLFLWGDYLIFNSIEFWGGENPIQPSAK